MVDNTIALQLKSPQLESPLNRMARGLQMQAFKAQADTAQLATAKNAMLNQAFSAAVDPKTGAIDYGKAAALLASSGGGAYAPDVLTAGAAATTAQTNAAAAKFKLGRDQIDASVRDIASYKTPADAIAHLKRSVDAGLVDSQTATALAAEIPQDPAQFEGWRTTKVRSLLTAAQQLETDQHTRNLGGTTDVFASPKYGGPGYVVPGSSAPITVSPDTIYGRETQLLAADRTANKPLPPVKIGKPGEEVLVYPGHAPTDVAPIVEPRYGTPPAEGVPGEAGQTMSQRAEAKSRQTFDQTLQSVADQYRQLDEMGGMVNTARSGASNLGTSIAASGLGQTVLGAAGTEAAGVRQNVYSAAQGLLAALKTANKGTSREYDTNQDVERALKTFSDPTKTMDNVRYALNELSKKYGSGKDLFPTKGDASSAPAPAQDGVIHFDKLAK